MKRLPCFICHFMHQRLHLVLKHTLDSQWIAFLLQNTLSDNEKEKKSIAEKCTCGVVSVVVLLMVSSIWAVWTSRVSNWCSNLSMSAEILKKKKTDSDYETLKNNNLLELLKRWNSTFSRFILFRVMSMPFTTPDIDFVTWEIKHHHEHADQNENKQVVAGFLGWQQHDPVINVPGSSLLQFGPLLPQHLPERSSWGGSRTGSSVWWHSLHGSSPLPCSPSGWPKDTQK